MQGDVGDRKVDDAEGGRLVAVLKVAEQGPGQHRPPPAPVGEHGIAALFEEALEPLPFLQHL